MTMDPHFRAMLDAQTAAAAAQTPPRCAGYARMCVHPDPRPEEFAVAGTEVERTGGHVNGVDVAEKQKVG